MLLLLLLTGCSGGTTPKALPTTGPLAQLDAAVTAVSADRRAVLAAVDAVQAAASALDRTDELCADGKGVPARAAHRLARPLAMAARQALSGLPALGSRYRSSLSALHQARTAVDGPARAALDDVVRGGRSEAIAVARFRTSAVALWPAYERLNADADVWITRAVTPWYRTQPEAAAAYAVLVGDARPALEKARAALGSAADAVRGPSLAQSATLASADEALAGLRQQG